MAISKFRHWGDEIDLQFIFFDRQNLKMIATHDFFF